MINDKLVTKTALSKNNKELYNKIKGYVDNNKSASMTNAEFTKVLTDTLVVKEDTDDLVFMIQGRTSIKIKR